MENMTFHSPYLRKGEWCTSSCRHLPGEYEDTVVGGQSDEDAVGGALHLGPAQNGDGHEVAHQPQQAHRVEEDSWQEELEEEVELALGRQRGRVVHLTRVVGHVWDTFARPSSTLHRQFPGWAPRLYRSTTNPIFWRSQKSAKTSPLAKLSDFLSDASSRTPHCVNTSNLERSFKKVGIIFEAIRIVLNHIDLVPDALFSNLFYYA